MKAVSHRRLAVVPMIVLAIQAFAPPAGASHSWTGYHWARSTSTFTLQLTNNLSSGWQPYLSTTSTEWSTSAVLDTTIVAGVAADRRCSPTTGAVRVCNATYGSTGWLGLASVSVSGSHIVKGSVKMNDSYFNTSTYNSAAWRNLVMCQEVGHTLGLDHQDENVDNPNLGTCMDYTRLPTSNQHPNQHDYDELTTIYSHVDDFTTLAGRTPSTNRATADLGHRDRRDTVVRRTRTGRPIVFEHDLGGGHKEFTFVVWAE